MLCEVRERVRSKLAEAPCPPRARAEGSPDTPVEMLWSQPVRTSGQLTSVKEQSSAGGACLAVLGHENVRQAAAALELVG